MADQPAQQVQVEAQWVESDAPVLFSNAFAVQPVKDEFIISFGTLAPPILGRALTLEEARNLKIQIKPAVRIGMTPGRLAEFVNLLQAQLKAYSDMLDREPN